MSFGLEALDVYEQGGPAAEETFRQVHHGLIVLVEYFMQSFLGTEELVSTPEALVLPVFLWCLFKGALRPHRPWIVAIVHAGWAQPEPRS